MIDRYIIRGDPIELPPDLFGLCATIVTTAVHALDVGFDAKASAKAGTFQGVDPAGPAYAAGLRNGMTRIARISGEQDSRVPLTYRVRDGSSERVLSWLPSGKRQIEVQEVRLADGSDAGAPSSCALGMVR